MPGARMHGYLSTDQPTIGDVMMGLTGALFYFTMIDGIPSWKAVGRTPGAPMIEITVERWREDQKMIVADMRAGRAFIEREIAESVAAAKAETNRTTQSLPDDGIAIVLDRTSWDLIETILDSFDEERQTTGSRKALEAIRNALSEANRAETR